MASFTVTAAADVRAPVAHTFDVIVPVDLSLIFRGRWPLPAVVATRDQTGDWDGAGQTRAVVFSGGGSARERLTGYERPRSFAYTVSDFGGVLGVLVSEADGVWHFEDVSGAVTRVDWSYTFHSRSALTAPVVWLIARALWAGYMRDALRASARIVESP